MSERTPLKRGIDLVLGAAALLFSLPVLLPAALAIWLQDRANPFYVSARIGHRGAPFRFVKLRTMIAGADRTKVDTTTARDPRITPAGRVLRRFKLDELPQFLHVLKGEMSLVGPRPNIPREAALYTAEERRMLDVRPGITDIASIVFSDLGELLRDSADPNLDYNQRIRPWKSRLALFYVDHASVSLDLAILWLTAVSLVSRRAALQGCRRLLESRGAPAELLGLCTPERRLEPHPPPGADGIVTSRG